MTAPHLLYRFINEMFLENSETVKAYFYNMFFIFLQILFVKWEQSYRALGTYTNNYYANIIVYKRWHRIQNITDKNAQHGKAKSYFLKE